MRGFIFWCNLFCEKEGYPDNRSRSLCASLYHLDSTGRGNQRESR